MEKRQRCFDIAGELKCDYLIVWDSDDYIHPEYQDWDWFHKQLERGLKTEHQDERIYYMWAWIPDESLWPKQYNEVPSNIWRQYTRIHKYPETMRYANTHWTFANKGTTDHQINLWKWGHSREKEGENPYLIPTSNTIDGIRITTDRLLRTQSDLEFGDSWTFQQTNWEEFNYNLIPYLKYKRVGPEHVVGMDVPMEKLYFKYQGKWTGEDEWKGQDMGQVVLLNDDGTETVGQQEYHITPELNEEDKPICEKCGQKIPATPSTSTPITS